MVFLKVVPSLIEITLLYVNKMKRGTLQEPLPDLNGFVVPPATVKKRDHLIEYVGSSHQRRKVLFDGVPVDLSAGVVDVIRKLQRQQVTGVQKGRIIER